MKLFKHMEPMLMLAFFLLCALGALQIGSPHKAAMTGDLVDKTDVQPPGARGEPHAAMALAMPAQIPLPMQTQTQTQMQTLRPKQMPVLTPMPTPMPVVHIIGRRMTDAEKSGAAASAG